MCEAEVVGESAEIADFRKWRLEQVSSFFRSETCPGDWCLEGYKATSLIRNSPPPRTTIGL